MELDDVLHLRRTTRKYLSQPVPDADLAKLLEAAQTAPLALGDHATTHLSVVRDPALMDEIRGAVRTVSRKTGLPLDPLHGAPALILVSATDLSGDQIELCNAACIIENMLLQATALGLGSTYIWGCLRDLRAREDLRARLRIPEGYTILSGFACGHPVNPLVPREKSTRLAVDWA